jgi:hypothetical protein
METAPSAAAAAHLLVAEPASPPAIAAASALLLSLSLSLSLRSQKSVEGGKAEREIWGGRGRTEVETEGLREPRRFIPPPLCCSLRTVPLSPHCPWQLIFSQISPLDWPCRGVNVNTGNLRVMLFPVVTSADSSQRI